MKKCKACGTPTRNSLYEGDPNPHNAENCMQCAHILYMVDTLEAVLNQPNLQGNRRIVKLSAVIKKP